METSDTPKLVPSSLHLAESYNKAVDDVAREKLWLGTTEGFPLESTIGFLEYITKAGLAQYFLMDGDSVVGWCDIIPKSVPEKGPKA